MKASASNLGLNIYIASGYRSYNTQKYLYNNYGDARKLSIHLG